MEKFGYSFANTEKKPEEKDNKKYDKEVCPFWIDMSKLFELYVYSLLREGYDDTIKYQLSDDGKRQTHGKHGDVDFLKTDEKLIIDTKYKETYEDEYKIEENLSSKIKGKIIWSQQIKKNIAAKREDRTFCRYQEYSVNCLENRLLKKTLLMIQRYLKHFDKVQIKPLIQQQNRLLNVLETVSSDISYQQIKMLKVNSLYKEYVEAINLAKKIMAKFGYSFANTEKKPEEKDNKKYDKEVCPFWIDMSKLFELYVYSLLREEYGNTIKYQLSDDGKRQTHGKYGDVDFLKTDEKLIIDTKYKETYKDEYKIEDIR
jgi:5-methylcytosine-specific restriction enzyme subunit McrC